uniref:Uncharacterized protein n=1 Tax=Fagus sylvatica TaxID=28930 RepID=A0A2N9FAE2_FAGSY
MFDEPTTPKKCHCLVFAFLDFDNVSGFLLALIKGNYHENLLTVHSQNFHHRVIGIPASSSKFHHGFDFVHGVLRCSWVATSGVLAMEIGASAGPTLAMEIGASAPGIEWLGQRR